jgi:hypothetical protein
MLLGDEVLLAARESQPPHLISASRCQLRSEPPRSTAAPLRQTMRKHAGSSADVKRLCAEASGWCRWRCRMRGETEAA